MNISYDFKYITASNAGDNSVCLYKILQDGTLEKLFCLPISGEYPKDVSLFPDSKHLVSCNNESDTLTFFNVDTEQKTLIMNGPEIKIEKPNCIVFKKLEEEPPKEAKETK